ncbi:hypothetical protein JYT31_00835 [Beggiatoa alba]|nr:hypothetical protein [Beggiatoa alba]
MYSNKILRFMIVVFLIIGLIPILLMSLQAGESKFYSMMFSAELRALLVGSAFAIVVTMVVLKISGISLEPIVLTIFGILALYVFCSTVAGYVPAVGLLVLVILGWVLSTWLLELPVVNGVFVGIVFFFSKFIGGLGAFFLQP